MCRLRSLAQVDLAAGPDSAWVGAKLAELCKPLGTRVVPLPDGSGLQLLGGELLRGEGQQEAGQQGEPLPA